MNHQSNPSTTIRGDWSRYKKIFPKTFLDARGKIYENEGKIRWNLKSIFMGTKQNKTHFIENSYPAFKGVALNDFEVNMKEYKIKSFYRTNKQELTDFPKGVISKYNQRLEEDNRKSEEEEVKGTSSSNDEEENSKFSEEEVESPSSPE